MFLSPKKKGSFVLWIACLLLLFDVRVFFGVIAALDNFATNVGDLSPELQPFVKFTDGKITVAIKSSDSFLNIPLIVDSSNALSFRASLSKECKGVEQKWKFEYPTGNVNTSLDLTWTKETFYVGEAQVTAKQNDLVDLVLDGSKPALQNVNKNSYTGGLYGELDPANAPSLPNSTKYSMSISVSPTSVGDGCVLTLEFDKEKFKLLKPAAPTSVPVPAPKSTKPSADKAGFLWLLLIVPVVVLLLIVSGVGIWCYVKRRRNQGGPAAHLERGNEVTCVSKTVRPQEKTGKKEIVKTAVAKEEGVKGNKSEAIAAITQRKDQKVAPESEPTVSVDPATPDVKSVMLVPDKTQEDPVDRVAIKKTKNQLDRLIDVNSELPNRSPKKQTPPTIFEENKQNSDYTKSTQDTLQLSK